MSNYHWSPTDCAQKVRLVRSRARRFLSQYPFALDASQLDDLIQEGWLGAFRTTPDDPRLPYRIDNQLRRYISLWVHGCTPMAARRAPRTLIYAESLEAAAKVPTEAVPVETVIEQQRLIRDIDAACSPDEHDLWRQQVESGGIYLTDVDSDAETDATYVAMACRRARLRKRLQATAARVYQHWDMDVPPRGRRRGSAATPNRRA